MAQKTHTHIGHNPFYNFVRSLELEGTPFSQQSQGISIQSSMRVSKLFGSVPQYIWPYDPTTWPSNQPKWLDKHASQYRIHQYFRVRCEVEIKKSLAYNLPVIVSVSYFSQWCETENGVIQFPSQHDTSIGNHCIVVVGYRDDHQYFKFRNSWSEKWGDDGYGWLPYGYFDQLGIEAHSIMDILNVSIPRYSNRKQKHRGIYIEEWGFQNPVRTILHGVSIFDYVKNEEVAWSFVFEESGSLDVEEFFVNPKYRQRGYAKEIYKSLNILSDRIDKPLRVWIPHIDSLMLGQDIHDIAYTFNLLIHESTVNWAAKILLPKNS